MIFLHLLSVKKMNVKVTTKDFMIVVFVSYFVVFCYLMVYFEPILNKSSRISGDQRNIDEKLMKKIIASNPKMAASILKELQALMEPADATEEKGKGHRETSGISHDKEQSLEEQRVDNKQFQDKGEELQTDNAELQLFNPVEAVLKPPEKRNGLGQMGVPVNLEGLSPEEEKKKNEMMKLHSFNAYLSEKISVHRSLPDVRDEKCKEAGRYSSNLPPSSVIICFHNEEWTALLRTVHSVLDRTKPDLLQEIILIDDFSSMAHLKEPLDTYMSYFEKVKVIHLKQREGLVRARIIGAKAAKATIITYLDSHCEATEGWLEPLIDTVHKNPNASAVPCIEIIHHETFHFLAIKCEELQVGGFDWNMGFTWHVVPNEQRYANRHPCDNIKSPTMAGGLFTINKHFFKMIGYYDEEMKVWGGENVAISFKIWMCGGRIDAVPCSHVGHIFRKENPYAAASVKEFGEFVGFNQDRVAEAWLDNHKKTYYNLRRNRNRNIDVSKELEIKKKLQCKSFDWYLDNVYPEQFVPSKGLAWGEVVNMEFRRLCLDSMGDEVNTNAGVYMCHKLGGHQEWFYTAVGEIRTFKLCLDMPSVDNIILFGCHGAGGNQKWAYNPYTNEIRQPSSNICLAIHRVQKNLIGVNCEEKGNNARWKFEYEQLDKIDKILRNT